MRIHSITRIKRIGLPTLCLWNFLNPLRFRLHHLKEVVQLGVHSTVPERRRLAVGVGEAGAHHKLPVKGRAQTIDAGTTQQTKVMFRRAS
jgi:hypothetical protein